MSWRYSGNENCLNLLNILLAFRQSFPWVEFYLAYPLYGQLMIPPIVASQQRWYGCRTRYVQSRFFYRIEFGHSSA